MSVTKNIAPLIFSNLISPLISLSFHSSQWLNNKEMFFTLRAEQILVEMSRKALTLEQELRAQVDRKRMEQHMMEDDEEDEDETGEEGGKRSYIDSLIS